MTALSTLYRQCAACWSRRTLAPAYDAHGSDYIDRYDSVSADCTRSSNDQRHSESGCSKAEAAGLSSSDRLELRVGDLATRFRQYSFLVIASFNGEVRAAGMVFDDTEKPLNMAIVPPSNGMVATLAGGGVLIAGGLPRCTVYQTLYVARRIATIRVVDDPAKQPFQAAVRFSIDVGQSGGSASTAEVQANKRLVIEYVSCETILPFNNLAGECLIATVLGDPPPVTHTLFFNPLARTD